MNLGKFWRPGETVMENVQTKKKTILAFEEWTFQQGLKASTFTRGRVKRGRESLFGSGRVAGEWTPLRAASFAYPCPTVEIRLPIII